VKTLAAAAWLAWAAPAEAAERRFAVLVGADEGDRGDGPLYFAERDAERVAGVLTALGGVLEEDITLLRGADRDRVLEVLEAVGRRAAAAPSEAALLFYYSGHADAAAMHLGPTRLSFDELTEAVEALPVALRVIVVDACRSGGLTRVRGATLAPAFEIVPRERLESRGLAVITSASSGEDAQESDRLGGGVFTHHFINGLRGAADASGDGEVTLSEVYQYSYARTLLSTSEQAALQHPTYAFDLRGRDDPVLTRIGDGAGEGRLALVAGGEYLVFDAGERGVAGLVAEVGLEGAGALALPAGRYLVRRRGPDRVEEATVRIAPGERLTLAPEDMDVQPYGRTVRRGEAASRRVAVGATAGAGVAGEPLDEMGPGPALTLGVRADLAPVTLRLRARASRFSAEGVDIDITHSSLGLDAAAMKLFEIGPAAAGLGVRVGAERAEQRFQTAGEAPRRAAWGARAGPLARVEVAPWPRLAVGLELGVDASWLPSEDPQSRGRILSAEVVPDVGFDVTWYPR